MAGRMLVFKTEDMISGLEILFSRKLLELTQTALNINGTKISNALRLQLSHTMMI